ncbi:hypothetical protein COEREDRAFT_8934 [Coemansia reversa NRRL 1564]|uniref:Velvet domain-containing protein n=1 Tax=Coemansia reversa (strain ATCC 12441 / NRRL 1564) TaxID=763665 RepID=A0A2G5BAD7_COERN|nr:hypothetical protein COEREDRAFT_8934 [Coemansia reversa NRRL 1564]|eukprot:PIA15973.1 hypothetical protein COEREDRAFT_8934 [Coemansia reversa NRRL 1564]
MSNYGASPAKRNNGPRYTTSESHPGDDSSARSQYSTDRDVTSMGGMAAMSTASMMLDPRSLLEVIPGTRSVDLEMLPPPDPFLQQCNTFLRAFQFTIVQHPIRARMCGSSDKDWRPLSPPAVLKFELFDFEGNHVIDTMFMQHLVVHTTLWSADKSEELTVVELPHNSNSKRISAAAKSRKRGVTHFGKRASEPGLEIENNLLGDYSASSSIVEDEHGERGCYFVFPNLSIRLEGRYRLRFMLIRLPSMGNCDTLEQMVPKTLSEIYSEEFDVYSIKTFPGMIESTPLSRALAQQGLKIPIRNTQDAN